MMTNPDEKKPILPANHTLPHASERSKRFREAWENHWNTPLERPVDLNWALEIRTNGTIAEPTENDESESR